MAERRSLRFTLENEGKPKQAFRMATRATTVEQKPRQQTRGSSLTASPREYVIQREFSFDEETQTETLTETVTVRETYKQEWTAYNKAQTNEKDRFLSLLAECAKALKKYRRATGGHGCPSLI